MKKDQKVQVSNAAPHHSGRIGYFQFFGEGASQKCAVLAVAPSSVEPNPQRLFVIHREHLQEINE